MTGSPQERILACAAELFMTHGYSQVAVDDIADALNMSKKTIYKHYAGKEALMDAVVEAFFADLNAKLTAVAQADLAYSDKLALFLKTVSTAVARSSRLLIADLAQVIPDVWEKILVLRRDIAQVQLTSLLRQGLEAGIVRPEVDPGLVLIVVLAALERAAAPQLLAQTEQSFDEVFEQVMAIVLRGVLNRGGNGALAGDALYSG